MNILLAVINDYIKNEIDYSSHKMCVVLNNFMESVDICTVDNNETHNVMASYQIIDDYIKFSIRWNSKGLWRIIDNCYFDIEDVKKFLKMTLDDMLDAYSTKPAVCECGNAGFYCDDYTANSISPQWICKMCSMEYKFTYSNWLDKYV